MYYICFKEMNKGIIPVKNEKNHSFRDRIKDQEKDSKGIIIKKLKFIIIVMFQKKKDNKNKIVNIYKMINI